MGLLDKIQARLDLYRLEKKYTSRKNRATLNTGAVYVDGEYLYSTDSANTLSANSTGSSRTRMGMSKTNSWMGRK